MRRDMTASVGLAAVTATLVAAPVLVAVPTTAAEPETCKGRVVTIGGTDGDDRIVGTRGRDVIRTGDGDDIIKSSGGNDVVCADRGADTLLGGAGEDRLHGGPFKLIDYEEEWGARGDRLVGGRGDDRIFGGGNPSNEEGSVMPEFVVPDRVAFPSARGGVTVNGRGVVTGPGIGRDRLFDVQHITGTKWADDITVRGDRVVVAAGGDDTVRAITGRNDSQLWPTLSGRAGDDRIDVSRTNRGYFEIHGGSGRDRITGSPKSELIFDEAGRGTVRGGGSYDQIGVTSRMTVRGEGGEDLLQVEVRKGRRGLIDGGAQRDRLSLANPTSGAVRLDLPARRLRVGKVRSGIRRVEAFGVPARRTDLTFIGSERADRLSTLIGKGRAVRIILRGGDDRFQVSTGPSFPDPAGRGVAKGGRGDDELDAGLGHDHVRLLGGGGDDQLDGNTADDVLRGGPGDDRADGWRGNDLCRAETKTRCER